MNAEIVWFARSPLMIKLRAFPTQGHAKVLYQLGSDTPSSSGHQNAALLFTIKILANQRIAKKRLQIQIFGQKKITLVSHFYHKIATFHINYLLSQNHHKFMILCSKDKVTFSSQIYVPHISITKLRFCGIKIFLVLSSFS